MAEYIKFRLTVAKAGVTMALLGLLGGLAQRAGADPPRSTEAHAAKTISWTPKLFLKGITGNLRTSLVTIEKDLSSIYAKEQKALTADVSSLKHLITAAKDNSYSKLAVQRHVPEQDGREQGVPEDRRHGGGRGRARRGAGGPVRDGRERRGLDG